MFPAENMGSVSDEARGKRFFGLRPQNDKKRKLPLSFCAHPCYSEPPPCHSERKRRIFPFRADSHLLYPSLRGRETPAAIRFPFIAHLLQICGFAGFYIVLSIISGTPLSSLVRRKLQRSTRRRGERNLPALRSTPLRAEGFFFRSSAAAHVADLPRF